MKSCEKNWSLATAARAVLLTAAVRGDDDDGHGKLHSMLPLRNRICPTRPTKGLNRDLNFHFVFQFSDFLGDFDPGESCSRSLGQT